MGRGDASGLLYGNAGTAPRFNSTRPMSDTALEVKLRLMRGPEPDWQGDPERQGPRTPVWRAHLVRKEKARAVRAAYGDARLAYAEMHPNLCIEQADWALRRALNNNAVVEWLPPMSETEPAGIRAQRAVLALLSARHLNREYWAQGQAENPSESRVRELLKDPQIGLKPLLEADQEALHWARQNLRIAGKTLML